MQTFGKAMRNSLPAIGLGLICALGVAGMAVVGAPQAVAQEITAKKEFVENINAASTALQSRQYQQALDKAGAALPHAKSNQEKLAVEQIRVAAYFGLKKYGEQIKSIEAAQKLGLPSALQQNYKKQLASAYASTNQTEKAVAVTKELIASGGATATEMAYVAQYALGQKKFDEAVDYANRAIKAGKKAEATHYNILLNAYSQSGKLDNYYETLERAAPIFKREIYWRPLVERAKKEPKYKANDALLDVYRALSETSVKLTPAELQEMGEYALNRGMAIESERVLAPLAKAGSLDDRTKRLYAMAQDNAKADKAGGLARSEAEAASKPTGDAFAATGESYLTAGDYDKAIELLQKALEKGQMEPGTTELVKLRLGIAQYKAGKKDAARKTWADVGGDNGAAWLARVWTAISKA